MQAALQGEGGAGGGGGGGGEGGVRDIYPLRPRAQREVEYQMCVVHVLLVARFLTEETPYAEQVC